MTPPPASQLPVQGALQGPWLHPSLLLRPLPLPLPSSQAILKDLDWLDDPPAGFEMRDPKAHALLRDAVRPKPSPTLFSSLPLTRSPCTPTQVHHDAGLLASLGLIDYSLLVGLSDEARDPTCISTIRLSPRPISPQSRLLPRAGAGRAGGTRATRAGARLGRLRSLRHRRRARPVQRQEAVRDPLPRYVSWRARHLVPAPARVRR